MTAIRWGFGSKAFYSPKVTQCLVGVFTKIGQKPSLNSRLRTLWQWPFFTFDLVGQESTVEARTVLIGA